MSWSQNGITRSSGPHFLLFHRKSSSSWMARSESISGSWLRSCLMSTCHYTLAQLSSFKSFIASSFLNADAFISVHCREESIMRNSRITTPRWVGREPNLQLWVAWCCAWVRQFCQLLAQPRRRVSGELTLFLSACRDLFTQYKWL